MAKKILIALCNCASARQTVKYVANVCSGKKDIIYALFHVQALIPQHIMKNIENSPLAKAEAEGLVQESDRAAKSTLEKFRGIMVREGIKKRSIQLLSVPMKLGIAKDILDKAEDGLYDAIVLGRQGLTPSRDTYIGSIAGKVIEHALKIPAWIVAGNARPSRVLLAVDGSQNSMRALDYVLAIAGAHPELRLNLFHVPVDLKYWDNVLETGKAYDSAIEKKHLQEIVQREDERRMKAFYERAYKKIDSAGIDIEHVKTSTRIWDWNISMAIIEEARVGRYGTIVVGRRGERQAFFSGQIVTRLLQKITDQALWVIP
jgi:nucleotide-binding universal stress UspA family protein